MFEKKNILGINITDAKDADILEYIVGNLEKWGKKWQIVTVNPEILMQSVKDSAYKKVINDAELALPDGIGIVIAGELLGKPLKGRVVGVDLLENLCKEIEGKPITVGFLGGKSGVAEKTAECLLLRHPNLRIAFVGSRWGEEGFENARKYQSGRNAGQSQNPGAVDSVDLLFVAFGAPKQELWIAKNLPKIPVRVAMGVGGAFDYISGKVKRAPRFIRLIGFEWLFRLIRQPWRFKRQLVLPQFILLVFREKLKGN